MASVGDWLEQRMALLALAGFRLALLVVEVARLAGYG
jgi:hypothetical protein